jgi:thioredoxin reductase (NADPH)
MVIASGVEYRQLDLPNAARFLGAGLYYAATATEARRCGNCEVIVVGGGNSAGQAAVFLASGCSHVHMLVRSSGLADSMSRYLIRRITETSNITLHVNTRIEALDGEGELSQVTWITAPDNIPQRHAIGHVFLMTGALPSTHWLRNCITLDAKSFIKTGLDLTAAELDGEAWQRRPGPQSFETNVPGIFAVGDVRSGSVKRVAAAVGEGSACIAQVHRALADEGG